VSRRYYHLSESEDGQLLIVDEGAVPRRWQLIHGSLKDRPLFGLVTGRDQDNHPIVEPMIGGDDGYPIVGRQVWCRGPVATRRRLGLPAPGRWREEHDQNAGADEEYGYLHVFTIDGAQCRVIARSAGNQLLVTAPLSPPDMERWTAQRAFEKARIVTLNTELASRYSDNRGLPIPDGAESLQLFGHLMPWTMSVPAEDTPAAVIDGQQSKLRVDEPVNTYSAKVALTAHIWRAGPRGGRLIGFEYGHSGTLAGIVTWTGKRDRALRIVAHEYESAYWLEYTNWIGGD
jgi:hypothetical protein